MLDYVDDEWGVFRKKHMQVNLVQLREKGHLESIRLGQSTCVKVCYQT